MSKYKSIANSNWGPRACATIPFLGVLVIYTIRSSLSLRNGHFQSLPNFRIFLAVCIIANLFAIVASRKKSLITVSVALFFLTCSIFLYSIWIKSYLSLLVLYAGVQTSFWFIPHFRRL